MLSVIIPTLNAAATLPACLEALVPGAVDGLIKELIVSDGGSTDATLAIADACGAVVVSGPKGRGAQLLAGAQAARGSWLLFVHADTVLEPGWVTEVAAFLRDPPKPAACFRFGFDDHSAAAQRVAFFANLRVTLFKLPYGDQGLLIRRALYEDLGGFEPLPLMEDVALVRKIGPKRLAMLDTIARTSAQKYRRDGFQRRAWHNLWLVGRYLLGAKPHDLAARYD